MYDGVMTEMDAQKRGSLGALIFHVYFKLDINAHFLSFGSVDLFVFLIGFVGPGGL